MAPFHSVISESLLLVFDLYPQSYDHNYFLLKIETESESESAGNASKSIKHPVNSLLHRAKDKNKDKGKEKGKGNGKENDKSKVKGKDRHRLKEHPLLPGNSSSKKSPGQGEDYGVIWIPVGAIVAGVAGAVGVAAAASAVGVVLAGGAAITGGVVISTIANNGRERETWVDKGGFVHQCDEACNPKCLADASYSGNHSTNKLKKCIVLCKDSSAL